MAPKTVNKAANLWVSRIIPLILIGIVAYVTWVVTVLICVDYLLKPPESLHRARRGPAIAVLVLYYVLFFFMTWSYFRLLYTVAFDSGFVERSEQWHALQKSKIQDEKNGRSHRRRRSSRQKIGDIETGSYSEKRAHEEASEEQRPGLDAFHAREVFICQGDGRPIWCTHCQNWKPDRTHHCREVDRCVRKMDHFCPWVGGVVSETSFKFFLQFVAWTAIYCTFNLILTAILVAETRRNAGLIDIHWVVTMAFGALFGLFTFGMAGSSIQFALLNTTTVENLSRKNVVHQIAIHMPRPPPERPKFPTIAYASSKHTDQPSADDIRTFAILHTKPGENPWDQGPYKNFQDVMGLRWYDWFLPLRRGPCCDHTRGIGEFTMGPVIDRLKAEAGITAPILMEAPQRKHGRRKRRRRSRHDSGHQDPDKDVLGTNRDVGEQHEIRNDNRREGVQT